MHSCRLFHHYCLVACLQARSQEARVNWEAALDTKDRAIAQLEEALASKQHALVRGVHFACTRALFAGTATYACNHQCHPCTTTRVSLKLVANTPNTYAAGCRKHAVSGWTR